MKKAILLVVFATIFFGKNAVSQADFQFLIGSCGAYEPKMGNKPTDSVYTIYKTMEKTPTRFMIWTGDAVYYRNNDWASSRAMIARNELYRKELPHLQHFLTHKKQYSVWDDHDFGPNNSHGDQANKDTALLVFKKFWDNPSYGNDSCKGVFFKFSQEDVDFFMLDDRYHSNPKTEEMLGRKQLNWLKWELKHSKARFKFIISGTQWLPDNHLTESYQSFKTECADFFDFLKKEAIKGVLLCSGDVHQSMLCKKDRKGTYPIYDFTASPLTSQFILPFRVPTNYYVKNTLYRHQNFGLVRIEGSSEKRKCILEIHAINGDLVWKKEIEASELE